MIDVNVKDINLIIKSMDTIFDNYLVCYNKMFNEFENSISNFNIGDNQSFINKINEEKKDTETLVKNFDYKLSLLKSISMYYETIGNSIKVDINKKNDLIKNFQECLEMISNITLQLSRIKEQSESANIILIRLDDIKQSIILLQNKCLMFFQEIETIEKNIKAKINEMPSIVLNDFKVVLDKNRSATMGVLKKDLLLTNIQKLNSLIEDEKNNIDKFNTYLLNIVNSYKSDNSLLFVNKIKEENNIYAKLEDNRKSCVDVLNSVITKYQDVETKIISNAERGE